MAMFPDVCTCPRGRGHTTLTSHFRTSNHPGRPTEIANSPLAATCREATRSGSSNADIACRPRFIHPQRRESRNHPRLAPSTQIDVIRSLGLGHCPQTTKAPTGRHPTATRLYHGEPTTSVVGGSTSFVATLGIVIPLPRYLGEGLGEGSSGRASHVVCQTNVTKAATNTRSMSSSVAPDGTQREHLGR